VVAVSLRELVVPERRAGGHLAAGGETAGEAGAGACAGVRRRPLLQGGRGC
jgi:hypothetical protein